MGATAKLSPDQYTDGVAFAERTGQLHDWHELLFLGLVPDTVGGGFHSGKAEILLNYVRHHPAYHIISFVEPGRYVNRYVNGSSSTYHLADGDADPNLACYPFLALDWHLSFEKTICEAFAVLNDGKNRR